MSCPVCGCAQTGSEFTTSGIVVKCLNTNCGSTWKAAAPQVEHEEDDDTEEEAARPETVKRTAVASKPSASLSPKSVVKLAKAELTRLNAEIRRLEKLKTQRDELKRLIAASKQPRPNRTASVRHLRATGE